MTDQMFTAEQREIIETMYRHGSVGEFLEGMSHYIRDLENLPADDYLKEAPMTTKFRQEWRTIDPYDSWGVARQYGNRSEARDDTERFPHRVVQQRLVSDWKDDE